MPIYKQVNARAFGRSLLAFLLFLLACLFVTWAIGEAFDWQWEMWEQRQEELKREMEEAAIAAGEPWEDPWRDPLEDTWLVPLEEEE